MSNRDNIKKMKRYYRMKLFKEGDCVHEMLFNKTDLMYIIIDEFFIKDLDTEKCADWFAYSEIGIKIEYGYKGNIENIEEVIEIEN